MGNHVCSVYQSNMTTCDIVATFTNIVKTVFSWRIFQFLIQNNTYTDEFCEITEFCDLHLSGSQRSGTIPGIPVQKVGLVWSDTAPGFSSLTSSSSRHLTEKFD